MVTAEDIQDLNIELGSKIAEFLQSKGWHFTCDTPTHQWVWSKDYKGRIILVDRDVALRIEGVVLE